MAKLTDTASSQVEAFALASEAVVDEVRWRRATNARLVAVLTTHAIETVQSAVALTLLSDLSAPLPHDFCLDFQVDGFRVGGALLGRVHFPARSTLCALYIAEGEGHIFVLIDNNISVRHHGNQVDVRRPCSRVVASEHYDLLFCSSAASRHSSWTSLLARCLDGQDEPLPQKSHVLRRSGVLCRQL